MDCNYTTIKTCELKGSTFRSHVLNFGDFDISEYEFSTDFANTLGHKVAEQTLDKFGNTVVLPLTVLEGKSGNIRADVWMTKDDVRDLAVRFEIMISSNCTGSSDTTEHDITVTFEELVIPVTVTQGVVNINLDYAAANQAAENANNAAIAANTAAENADEKAQIAETAAGTANQAAVNAGEATTNANTAATNANQAAGFATQATQEAATATGQAQAAASSANSAAGAANSAATNANDKAAIAQTAANNADQKAAAAQTATTNANTATGNANTAASAANTAAQNALSGISGIAQPNDTIPATGFFQKIADTAQTYTNYKDSGNAAIVVTAADLDVVNGVRGNEVILAVKDGVATKRVYRKKGDAIAANPVFNPENNTEAPTMKAVADYVNFETVISNVQIFDKNNYNLGTSFGSTNVNVALTGGGVTPYYNIPEGNTHISFSGLGTSAARRIAWMTGLNGGGTLVSVNTTALSSATIPIPATAKSFRFFFQRSEDGDVTGTFMLNFGALKPYEPYEAIEAIGNIEIAEKKPNTIKTAYAVLSGTSPTVNASKWYKKTPVVADVAMKGNTGLGYDLKRNLFVVAEYNTTISSKILVFRNSDLVEGAVSAPYRTIDLTAILDHIQGVTWDFVDDTYLALGTKKGAETGTTNSVVIKVSPIGTVLDVFELGDNLTVQVGMIDVLIDGNIVIKPNVGSYAYVFNRNYALINRVVLIGEEGIAVNKFNGDIWCADSNFTVKKYDKNFVELATYTFNTYNNESAGSNVEGMAILPDGSLVISADAFLHGGTALGNALFFFDFEATVNKRRYFYLPNGIGEYKDLKGEYVTEIIKPAAAVTSVVVESEKVNKKFYRNATTISSISAAAFSSTLTSNTYFQTKITI